MFLWPGAGSWLDLWDVDGTIPGWHGYGAPATPRANLHEERGPMLRYTLLHPPLLSALARSGHGGRILLADGNYPCSTIKPPQAEVIHLNLSPGLVGIDDVLRALLDATPVEAATLMQSPEGAAVPAHETYRALLGPDVTITEAERFAFYDEVCRPSVATVVATGDTRICANLLLTIGVRVPGV